METSSRRRFVQAAALLGGTALLAGPAFAAPPALAGLLRRHAAARGSMRHIRSLTTAIAIDEMGAVVNGHYAATRAPAERMRIDVFYQDKRVYSEGLDAEGAWQMEGGAAAPVPSLKGAGALQHGVVFNLYGLEDIPALGGTLRPGGTETIDGIAYPVIAATLADGFATSFYLDPKSWLIAKRRDVRPIHPDLDNTFKPMETGFGDYRRVQGVRVPFKSWQTDLTLGKTVQTTATTALAFNVTLSDSMLARGATPI
jgi:hypothetical protein